MSSRAFLIALAFTFAQVPFARLAAAPESQSADVVVYGGSPAGIAAAVQTARMGRSVILVSPGKFLGGLMTGGLGASDKGVTWTVGGLSLEFFQRIYDYYQNPDVWAYETRAEWVKKHGQTTKEIYKSQYYFEPHVAGKIFARMLSEAKVSVVRGERLNRKDGVKKDGATITEIVMESGLRLSGKYYVDATYEGDLMAAAGVEYIVGREDNTEYGETLNGIQFRKGSMGRLDPYVEAGNPQSGLLPRILDGAPGPEGSGDGRTQAYNFRMCLTDVPENRVPFTKPENYNPLDYELILRAALNRAERNNLKEGRLFFTRTPMPNRKTDSNNTGPLSTDFIGGNHAWPEASYAEREKLLADHKTYVQGFFYFLSNDPRVPEEIRKSVGSLGLAKDEFVDNDNWPTQLYVREARRMVGDFVMNERHFARKGRGEDNKVVILTTPEPINDPIAVGSYALDSHKVTMFATPEGELFAEGGFYAGVLPYPISLRILFPKPAQVDNLLVVIAVSASHVAYGTLRMEPVYMELGQAAATVIGLALEDQTPVHQVPYAKVRQRLLADRAVIDHNEPDLKQPRSSPQEEEASDTSMTEDGENPDIMRVANEELPTSERTLAAIQVLTDVGIISNPDYWREYANPSSSCDGRMVSDLIVAYASSLDSGIADIESAITALVARNLIKSEAYWKERTAMGAQCPGGFVAGLLVKMASNLKKTS